MKPEDKFRIQHMIEASVEALSFVKGIKKREFKKNRILILSVIKEIEIIGEAAAKISKETCLQNPDVLWKDITGMRNRLIHGYFEVDVNRVWDTIQYNLPHLIKSLEKIIK